MLAFSGRERGKLSVSRLGSLMCLLAKLRGYQHISIVYEMLQVMAVNNLKLDEELRVLRIIGTFLLPSNVS
jgi:hypothetical protein